MNELSTIDCIHFGPCSGCTINEIHPPIWNEVKNYFHSPTLHIGAICHWRIKAKLAVRGTIQNPTIGLFRSHSHDVLPIPKCKVHHLAINQIVEHLIKAIQNEKIVPYQEKSHAGSLRYIQCHVDLKTNLIQLTLVWNHSHSEPFMDRLANHLKPYCHSIWFNFQPAQTNRILGDEWLLVSGEQFLYQTLSGHPIAFHPASFSQAHWTLFERLGNAVSSWVPQKSHLVEIYAGVGALGILAASDCSSVTLIENNPYAQTSFLATNHPSNVCYLSLDASEAIPHLEKATCVIVDPPRKGLAPLLLKALSSWEGRLIYVSCDFYSFKRDVEILRQNGWTITKGDGYLLFPGTDHVEIAAVLDK